jgi:hypothetical protein
MPLFIRQSDDFGEPLHGVNQESSLAVVRPALADCTTQTIRYRSTVSPENADDTPGAGSIGRWRERGHSVSIDSLNLANYCTVYEFAHVLMSTSPDFTNTHSVA